MADLSSYVGDKVVNGHCDCMFLYNTFRWPWTRIAALIAPRPLLFINSDHDTIFPMNANERISNALERFYSLFGAGDRVDALVSIGGHDYRKDIRQGAYRFINTYLKNDPRPVDDSEVDLVTGSGEKAQCPIAPERLRVFATDAEIPADQKNTSIDQHFVPMARVELPAEGGFSSWKERLMAELRQLAFRPLTERVPPGEAIATKFAHVDLNTEEGIEVPLLVAPLAGKSVEPGRVILYVIGSEDLPDERMTGLRREGDPAIVVVPRGMKHTLWTRKNPPNYVERAHVLVGRTVDEGRVRDVAAAARYLNSKYRVSVVVAGKGASGVIAAYAALLEPDIAEVIVVDPPKSHMDAQSPQILNVLRVLDIPEAFGLIAPRPLTLIGADDALADRVAAIYASASATERLSRP
jgi:hypothetical protein